MKTEAPKKVAHYRIRGSVATGFRWIAYSANNKKIGYGRGYNTKKAAVKGVRACRAIKLIVDIDGKTIIP